MSPNIHQMMIEQFSNSRAQVNVALADKTLPKGVEDLIVSKLSGKWVYFDQLAPLYRQNPGLFYRSQSRSGWASATLECCGISKSDWPRTVVVRSNDNKDLDRVLIEAIVMSLTTFVETERLRSVVYTRTHSSDVQILRFADKPAAYDGYVRMLDIVDPLTVTYHPSTNELTFAEANEVISEIRDAMQKHRSQRME